MPAVVIPVYNRPRTITRLLDSLERADYPENVTLIISVEGDASDKVVKIVEDFSHPLLEIEIIRQPKRLGLKGHILACGDLTEQYGSIVLLEDDLVVDRYFYHYAQAALAFYDDSPEIADIALYGYEYNEYTGFPFRPVDNGYSTYLMQAPCSWGQCWTARQWRSFRGWLSDQADPDAIKKVVMPDMVKQWPSSSWKKYYAAYLVEQGLYVVYPYRSYSSNCSDPGEHIRYESHVYQVAMGSQNRKKPEFDFCPPRNREVAYDAFMEPAGDMVFERINMSRDEVEIDLYGIKADGILKRKSYALTCCKVRNPIKGYALRFRPIENNFLYPLDDPRGADISLASSDDILGRPRWGCREYSYLFGFNLCTPRVMRRIVAAMFKGLVPLIFKSIAYLLSLPRKLFGN